MRKGIRYEDTAAKYLERLGYRILKRNYHCRTSEIDIIAIEGDELVFVEVKGGVTEDFGHPVERFTPQKLTRVIECAYAFMEEKALDCPFRIDLIVVLKEEVKHFKNVSYE